MQAGGRLAAVDDLQAANRLHADRIVSDLLQFDAAHGGDHAIVIGQEILRGRLDGRAQSGVDALLSP